MYGYQGKMLFVNLSTGAFDERALDEETAKNYIGGPALGAKVLYDNMPAGADALGPENMIGFVTGPLNNTGALFGGRYTVVCKSPVTGGWNDSNSGGYFGADLRKAGYDAVFVNGVSDKPVYILIEEGNAKICDASELWGLTVKAAEAKLKEKHGEKINAAVIGPAGENLGFFASIMNDSHRAAGRGGSGAVMGSKNLKAVVVKGNARTQIADRDKLVGLNRVIAENLKGPGAGFAAGFGVYGSGASYTASVMSGDAGVKNWSGSGVADYPEETALPVGSIGLDSHKIGKYNCSNCPLGCGAFLSFPDSKWELKDTPRPEYETQGAFGSLLLNGNAESVCACNEICNEYGLDTISCGSTIAWAMECYNEGVLTRDDLDGIDLAWGDGDAIVALCEKIAKNDGIGKILAKGSREASRILGKGEQFLVVASGIEEPQHDSRLGLGLARTYKYDPTPGRHVKGGLGIGSGGPDFDYETTGPADLAGTCAQELQNASGYCLFGGIITPPGHVLEDICAVTGFSYTPKEEEKLGRRLFMIRHAFNVREGLTRKDFTLSERFVKADPPFTGPVAGVTVDVEKLADNFFEAMHLDKETLKPDKDDLAEIGGLENVIKDL